MNQPDNILQWLQESPLEEEIDYNDDGSEFIPIGIVENLLSVVDPFWSTDNFKFRIFAIGERTYASSSVELYVTYAGRWRRLVGASTVEINAGDNAESVSLSESLKNSSKKLGPRLGQNLNGRNDAIVREENKKPKTKGKPAAVKMNPDKDIQGKYNKAFERNDEIMMGVLNQIYDIKYQP